MARSKLRNAADEDTYLLEKGRLAGTKTTGTRTLWSLEYKENTTLAPWFDAAWLMLHVGDTVLLHHHEAILKGKKADGSGDQPPLSMTGRQGKRAAAGKRPDDRGHTGLEGPRAFPNAIRRKKITVSKGKKVGAGKRLGTVAKTAIAPATWHAPFAARELAENNVEYLYTEGDVEELIEQSLKEWVEMALFETTASGPGAKRRLVQPVRYVRPKKPGDEVDTSETTAADA